MIKRSIVLFLFLIPLSSLAQPIPGLVSECDFCMCSEGLSALELGQTSLRYDARYTDLTKEYSNGALLPNASGEREAYLTNELTFTYQFAPGWSLSMMAPFARKSMGDAEMGEMTTSGAGDISLLARYNIIDHAEGDTRVISLKAGAKLATGSTSQIANGELADPDLQLGTGTTDVLAGAGYLVSFSDWGLGANVLAGIRAFGSGANGHVYGNNLNYDIEARYCAFREVYGDHALQPMLFTTLALRGEWRGYEQQDGVRIDNSGGNVMYVAPGMQFFLTRTVAFDASVWLPVVHALNGNQLGESVKVLGGVQLAL